MRKFYKQKSFSRRAGSLQHTIKRIFCIHFGVEKSNEKNVIIHKTASGDYFIL
jgi:hypothetical protein